MRQACAIVGLVAIGCTSPATQLVVAVDTDFEVPAELSYVRARVEGPDGRNAPPEGWTLVSGEPDVAAGEVEIPFSFGVAPRSNGEELDIVVIVEGFRRQGDAAPLVSVRATTGFVEGKRLRLPLFLAKVCEQVWTTCGPAQTCDGGVCVDDNRPPQSLEELEDANELDVPPPEIPRDGGMPPPRDGGMPPPRDGGLPPCDEPPPVLTVPIGIDPNVDLLATDLDGDGVVEIATARGDGRDPSAIAFVDFESCYEPVVTATTVPGQIKQGLVTSVSDLFVVEKTRISRWAYRGPNDLTSEEVIASHDIERLAFSSDGTTGLVVIDPMMAWTYAAFDPVTGVGVAVEAPERPKGFSAHLDGATFVHSDDLMLHAIDPSVGLAPVREVIKPRDPVVVVRGDDRIVAARAEELLVTQVWRNGVVVATATVTFADKIDSGPVPLIRGDDLQFVVVLETSVMTGCVQVGNDCTAMPEHTLTGATIDDKPRLFTARIDSDDWPDVVFVAKNGLIFFMSGAQLDTAAAPMIDLAMDTKNGSAIVLDFFAPFGLDRSALVVQHANELSIIPLAATGDPADLWLQARRDRTRSARAP